MSQQHTATPWELCSDRPGETLIVANVDGAKLFISVAECHLTTPDNALTDLSHGNAAYIVQAVNSHAELLEALKVIFPYAESRAEDLEEEAESRDREEDHDFAIKALTALEFARAAIAKAEGRE